MRPRTRGFLRSARAVRAPRAARLAAILATLPALALSAVLLTGCINVALSSKKPFKYYELGGTGEAVVYLMRIDGIITTESSIQGVITGNTVPGTVEQVRFQLDRLVADNVRPAGLIVRVNSPGGTVTASDIVYHELTEFKRRHRIPVVALMMDMATSGGYYVSMAADSIVAHPTTTTGSLGVIMPAYNIARFMERYGVEDRSVTSGPLKDLHSPTRPVRSEHTAVVQSVVDDLYERFLQVVQEGRGDRLKSPLRTLADGRIYTANQALAAGLVDRVGYYEDALEEMKRLTGLADFRVITLAIEPDVGEVNVYMAEAGRTRARPSVAASLLGLENPPMAPFYYLWLPQ